MVRKVLGGIPILLAIVAGELYFIHRYWWWMNDSTRASGVQAAAAIVLGGPTLVFAIFATIAAIQSAEASIKQATAADRQAAAANAQAEAGLNQSFAAAKQTELLESTLALNRLQTNAAQRPFVLVEREVKQLTEHVREPILVVHNNGDGPVTDAYWIQEQLLTETQTDGNKPNWVRIGSISKGGMTPLRLRDGRHFASGIGEGIIVHYKDLSGAFYYCRCTSHFLGTDNDNGEIADGADTPLRAA
jgi:hypothetical protein